MSTLKTKAEDLLSSKINDARAIAKSTLANDEDDLVSDKDREKDDGGSSDSIDQALKTGKVHQESSENILEDLAKEMDTSVEDLLQYACESAGIQIVVTPEQILEAKSFNEKVFLNKSEQNSFAHFMARKEMKDPMSGLPMMDDLAMIDLAFNSSDFKQLENIISEGTATLGLSSDDKYLKVLSSIIDKATGLEVNSPEILMWRTLTSRLQPMV